MTWALIFRTFPCFDDLNILPQTFSFFSFDNLGNTPANQNFLTLMISTLSYQDSDIFLQSLTLGEDYVA